MSFRDFVSDSVFKNQASKLGIRIRGDRVYVGHSSGLFAGSRAEVSASASRGTLTRSMLQAGWQKRGHIGITIVTADGVELFSSVKNEAQARRFAAEYNTRSGAHKGN